MRILLDETQLHQGVKRLAEEIDTQYAGQPLTVVAVMTGSLILFADLIRQLSIPVRVGVIQASSYRGETTAGELAVDTRMLIDVEDRNVLLVDDIFDTGQTLARLTEVLAERGARSVRSAVLLYKQRAPQRPVRPDFVAFEIPDEFVVGYGLDYRELLRNLPYLAVLEPTDFERIDDISPLTRLRGAVPPPVSEHG